MTFKFNEMHHGYIGLIFLICGFIFMKGWLFAVAIIILADEAYQIINDDQYGGPIHKLYVATLYKIPWIKKFNIWVDRLLGKEI